MKNKLIKALWAFTMMAIVIAGCSDDDTEVMQAPQSAIDKALLLISGTVTETETEIEDGIAAWKVDITTAQGSEVEVYCRQDNGALLRIDGESAPFDYNITPGMGLIDFSQAKAIADGEVAESLVFWRLRTEDSFNDIWVYTMEYTQSKVSLNATDGSVLDIEN